jgi:hypothetical protein
VTNGKGFTLDVPYRLVGPLPETSP